MSYSEKKYMFVGQDDTKGILTDKKKAVTFLSRHKRSE